MTGKIKKILSAVSLVLCVLTAFLIPTQVAAQEITQKESNNETTLSGSQESEDYQIGNIVSEITEERDKYSKQFRLDDGTYMAVSYNQPIHYKNDDGEWVEYNNSLINSSEATATDDEVLTYSEDSTDGYTNQSSDIKVNYSKKSKENNMIKIKANDYSISWGYKNTNKVNATIVNNDEELKGNDKYTVLKNQISETIYENIYDNVDIQYFTTSVGIKENIILKDANAQNEFSIQYKFNTLTAESVNEKLIELKDKSGNTVYSIEAPYMVDAKGRTSTQLIMSIIEQKNGKLTVKLTADKDFLSSPDCQYPVTIDPTFTTKQGWGKTSCAYVDDAHPNTSYGYGSSTGYTGTIFVGSFGSGNYLSYIKLNELPALNKGDIIVNATLNTHLYINDFYDDMYISAHQVTSSWSQSTITYNNRPSNNSTVLDYEKITPKSSDVWHDWDITKIVKQWYNGTANYGIMLKPLRDDDNYQCASFYSGSFPESQTPRPVFQLTYRNNKGLEDYWTYSSFSVGTAGTAYVNDYSGNLVFVNSNASTASGYAPASIQHVYNGYMASVRYNKTSPFVGHGWKLNIQQTVLSSEEHGLKDEAKDNYPFVYTDEDGTEHYFYKKTENGKEKYFDEDGLGLELTINKDSTSEYYVISDDKDNKIKFNSRGLLTSTVDSNGNKISVYYCSSDETVIDYITDGSGNKLSFDHNEKSYYLNNISDPSDRKTIYYYNTGMLTQIKYPNNATVDFTYDSDEALTSVTDVDGYKVTFSYSSSSSGKKVTAIQEYGANGTAGQKITFDRTQYNTTVIKTYGADGISGTEDDLTSTYQFDNFGRTKSIKSKTTTRDLGASVYKYTSGVKNSSADNIKQLNRVSTEYSTGSNPVNLIKNSSMETNGSWTAAEWNGTNTFSVTYDSSKKYFGKKSLKINVTSYENDSRGRVYQDFSNSVLLPGKTYTLSGYIRTENITNGSENSGAILCAESFNSDGTYTPAYSDFVYGNTSTSVDGGWQRVSVTFTVPNNSSKTRIHLALRRATGSAYFDGIQLEQYNIANDYNLIENGGLENYSSNGLPTGWYDAYSTLDTSTDKKSDTSRQGDYSFRIKGDSNKAKSLYQDINVSGTENDTYIVSGWASANAIPKDDNDTRKFKISIMVSYSDGTSVYKDPAEFNYSVSGWQFTSAAFTLSDETSKTKTPTSIRIYLSYQYQENYAYFDNICLEKDNAQSYTYDKDGKLISVVDNSQKQSTMEYTNSDLTKSIDAKGYAYEYEYDKKHNLTDAKSQNGVNYHYAYNNKGLATSLVVSGNNVKSLKTEVTYDNNGMLATSTDTDGNKSSYSYNEKTGTLTSVTDDSGTTSYTYNSNTDQLTGISKTDEEEDKTYTIGYKYSSDSKYLKSINHNGTSYNIEYDQYGNKTDSKVGTQSLAKYAYNSKNGALVKTTYGTGQTVGYTYDAFGNVCAQKYNGTTAFTWTADRSGTVTRERDYINDIQYDLTYDSTGRLVRKTAKDTSGSYNTNNSWYTLEYSYDLNNNITRLANCTLSRNNINKYEYGKDNLLTKFLINENRNVSYSYDGLNRLTGTTLNTVSPINTSYTYYQSTRGADYTTNLIETETIDGVTYKYSYDTLGNIENISKKNSNDKYEFINSYEYDAMNQLTYAYDAANKTVCMYGYDNGGNMTVEVVHNLGSNGAPINTTYNRYTYGDSNWTDKLTAYNGQEITYD
ncbi:MAG: RHS repeat protein, partial [Ruminococcus sp.]|nr:RHS repeat protein [Ruminococcus sp.]